MKRFPVRLLAAFVLAGLGVYMLYDVQDSDKPIATEPEPAPAFEITVDNHVKACNFVQEGDDDEFAWESEPVQANADEVTLNWNDPTEEAPAVELNGAIATDQAAAIAKGAHPDGVEDIQLDMDLSGGEGSDIEGRDDTKSSVKKLPVVRTLANPAFSNHGQPALINAPVDLPQDDVSPDSNGKREPAKLLVPPEANSQATGAKNRVATKNPFFKTDRRSDILKANVDSEAAAQIVKKPIQSASVDNQANSRWQKNQFSKTRSYAGGWEANSSEHDITMADGIVQTASGRHLASIQLPGLQNNLDAGSIEIPDFDLPVLETVEDAGEDQASFELSPDGDFVPARQPVESRDEIDPIDPLNNDFEPAVQEPMPEESDEPEALEGQLEVPSFEELESGIGLGLDSPSEPIEFADDLDFIDRGLADDTAAWWVDEVGKPQLTERRPQRVTLDNTIFEALRNAPQVQILNAQPQIQERIVQETDAAFDWNQFVNTSWREASEPIGSGLQTGIDGLNRFEEREWSYEAGYEKQLRNGSSFSLSQSAGTLDNNSSFLNPPDQGTSRLVLDYRHPLMRGRGQAIATSQVALARLDLTQVESEAYAELQNYLIQVVSSYWEVYLRRANFVLQRRSMNRASELLRQLRLRQGIDVKNDQILRAEAAFASRRSAFISSKYQLMNAQDRLINVTYGPRSMNADQIELIVDPVPFMLGIEFASEEVIQAAIRNRPEVRQAFAKIRAGSVQKQVAANQLLPRLDAVVQSYVAGIRGDRDFRGAFRDQFTGGDPSYSVGLQFELPIGNRAAKNRYERSELEVQVFQREFEQQVGDVVLDARVSSREIERLNRENENNWAALQKALEELRLIRERQRLNLDDQKTGSLYIEDVLASQERLTAAESRLAESQTAQAIALLDLKRATGQLLNFGDRSIQSVNFQPVSNSSNVTGDFESDGFSFPSNGSPVQNLNVDQQADTGSATSYPNLNSGLATAAKQIGVEKPSGPLPVTGYPGRTPIPETVQRNAGGLVGTEIPMSNYPNPQGLSNMNRVASQEFKVPISPYAQPKPNQRIAEERIPVSAYPKSNSPRMTQYGANSTAMVQDSRPSTEGVLEEAKNGSESKSKFHVPVSPYDTRSIARQQTEAEFEATVSPYPGQPQIKPREKKLELFSSKSFEDDPLLMRPPGAILPMVGPQMPFVQQMPAQPAHVTPAGGAVFRRPQVIVHQPSKPLPQPVEQPAPQSANGIPRYKLR